jgi:predicted RNase H-like HicB family nuclease
MRLGRASIESYCSGYLSANQHFNVQFQHQNLDAQELAMTYQFDVIVEKDSAGYFVASVPALAGCHTQAKSLDELMERIREAIELCLEVHGNAFEPLDFVGVQRISVAA